jgi:sugar lactone lactonase YvrE
METVNVAVLSAHHCTLGEGAAYDAVSDTAWWFDILERQLFEARLGTGETLCHALPFMGSVLARVDDRRQLISSDYGLFVRDMATGKVDLHTVVDADRATRSNDGRVHPSGALWLSTMGRKAETGRGAIYRFFEGALTLLYGNLTIPNAICFSADGGTAYFTDSRQNVMLRVATDPATGAPVGEPQAIHDNRGNGSDLDGSVIDAEGLIWNARWGAGCVDAYTPDGERVRSIAVPARQPTCPVFVGKDFSRLLVTSASQGIDVATEGDDPQHGCTFLLDVGARGRPEPSVRLTA